MSETPKKKTAPRKTAGKKREVELSVSSYVPPTHHDVELLAYGLWVDGGGRHGDDAQD